MTEILFLPVRLDALWLAHTASSTGPLCDPSQLPWVDGRTGHDRNPDNAFLADTCRRPPFETAAQLEAGVHLHWALPDPLRRAVHPLDPRTGELAGDAVAFPRIPDRWLVTRSRQEGGSWQERARWLVQSDWLWPADRRPPEGTVGAVLPSWCRGRTGPPFRYLGRVVPLAVGAPPQEVAGPGWERFTGLPLTAVGPCEELAFAALYPNCRNVLGLHDAEPGAGPVRYEVLGWYADPAADLVAETLAAAARSRHYQGMTPAAVLAERLHRELEPGAGPERLACYGRLQLDGETPPRPAADGTVQVAVGNTPEEALVAHLADDVDDALGLDQAVAERCLQALRCGRRLEGQRLDMGPRLEQALHAEGFEPVAGGTRWRVVRREQSPAGSAPEQITLPAEAAHRLEALNRAQAAADQAAWRLDWQAEQLYCDWVRTMTAVYRPHDRLQDMPDPDQAMDWLERALGRDGEDAPDTLAGSARALESARTALAEATSALDSLIAEHNRGLAQDQQWTRVEAPATRFWLPADPAVLLSSEDNTLQASPRYHGTPPPPAVVSVASWDLAALLEAVPAPFQAERDNEDHHPLLLEWRVEVTPLRASPHILPETRRYEAGWIYDHYDLAETEQDLRRRDPTGDTLAAGLVYEGRSLLTPSAPVVLLNLIEDWLGRWLADRVADFREQSSLPAQGSGHIQPAGWLPDWKDASTTPAWAATELDGLGTERGPFLDWLGHHCSGLGPGPAHPAQVLLAARDALNGKRDRLLGQRLSGFNRSMLGLRDGLPLEIDDPLGFTDYRQVTADLRDAVAGALAAGRGWSRPRTSPRPYDEFLPIRSGALRLLALRLVDTFGRPTELRWSELDRPAALAWDREDRVALPPRFSQPARLDLRWLSAEPLGPGTEEVDAEANDHPASSPVCGWLVADHLDRSVLVFDGGGRAMGAVEPPGRWRPPPGGDGGALRPEDLPNPFLRRTVRWLVEGARSEGFLDAFLDAVEAALEAIEPEDHHQHEALSLLASRPLAVVRARLGLILQGPPAVDQGWHAFHATLAGGGRSTRGLEDVRVPVRLGEHRMLDDGVVGFFVEESSGGFQDQRLLCPQGLWATGGATDSNVREWQPGEPALNVPVSAGGEPVNLTLLVDPRARIHATCGVLPTRSLDIPPDQFRDSLARLALWFRAMPVLSGPGDLELDLPDEPGCRWSWVAQLADRWERRDPGGRLHRAEVGDQQWQTLLAAGRLEVDPHHADEARWVPPEDAPEDPVPEKLSALLRDRIVPAPRRPTSGETTAREGWLVLRHDTTSKEP